MRNPSIAAAATALLILTPSIATQGRRQQAALDRATHGALRVVQAALHSAERAQLRLLENTGNATARRAVDLAVEQLAQARQALRRQLAGPTSQPIARRSSRRTTKLARPNPLRVEQSIQLGLRWLRAHQDESGKWDSDHFFKHDEQGSKQDGVGNAVHDVGATGLALLAFLGAGNTTSSGPHRAVVQKAAHWLTEQQGANGLFGTPASHDFIYDHAIAAFAMSEAYGLSKDKRLQRAAQRGINYLESHRNPYACWRYQPRDNDNDSSVTGWCLKAYRSASDFGLEVNGQALKIIANFYDELTSPSTGQLGYTKRGERSSRHPGNHSTRFPIEKGDALTALGLAGRFDLGQTPKQSPVMRLAAQRLLQKLPKADDAESIDHYFWFHGTRAMWRMGGKYWDLWSRAVAKAMLDSQRKTGHLKGSWDSAGVWGNDGGRVYSTAMLVLSMQTIGRYISLTRVR